MARVSRTLARPWSGWLVGAVAAAVQVVADVGIRSRVSPLYGDGGEYYRLATGLVQHGQFGHHTAFRPPGWVFLLAGAFRVVGVHPVAGLALNVLFTGLTAALLTLVGRRIGLPPALAALAGLGAGAFPWTLILGATLYSEALYGLITVALCLAIQVVWERRHRVWLPWIGIGLISGAGALVRPTLLLWIPLGLVIAASRPLRPSVGTGTTAGMARLAAAAALMLGFLAVLTPWTIRNYQRFHAVIPIDTGGGSTLASANNDLAGAGQNPAGLPSIPPGNEVQGDRAYRRAAIQWITSHPGTFAIRMVERVVRGFDPVSLLNKGVVGPGILRWIARGGWAVVVLLALVGVVRRHRGRWLVPVSLLLPVIAELAVFGGGFRFLAPAIPFVILWAAAGVEQSASWWQPGARSAA